MALFKRKCSIMTSEESSIPIDPNTGCRRSNAYFQYHLILLCPVHGSSAGKIRFLAAPQRIYRVLQYTWRKDWIGLAKVLLDRKVQNSHLCVNTPQNCWNRDHADDELIEVNNGPRKSHQQGRSLCDCGEGTIRGGCGKTCLTNGDFPSRKVYDANRQHVGWEAKS